MTIKQNGITISTIGEQTKELRNKNTLYRNALKPLH